MASNEQKDKLLFAEVDVIRKCPRMRAMQMEDMLRLELMQNIQVYRFDVWESGWFGDKKVGNGTALRPVGICFVTYRQFSEKNP